ncbi:hypothetical protein HanRHA438_Chr13g0620441 [Helianthus annuus]|nr:hypothetical protein HanRHA438_Chr13g0620441 [Helianthus annuus]
MIQAGLINHLDVRRKGYEKKPSTNDSGLPNKYLSRVWCLSNNVDWDCASFKDELGSA